MKTQGSHGGTGRLFLALRSGVSGRHVILEDDGYSVLLYLTSPTEKRPAADCFVYSVAPPTEELSAPRDAAGPPILLRRFATEVAFQPNVPADSHSLKFSADGHSAAVFIRGEPWAFIPRAERLGYSKSISAPGPFGRPWNQDLFDELFPSDQTA